MPTRLALYLLLAFSPVTLAQPREDSPAAPPPDPAPVIRVITGDSTPAASFGFRKPGPRGFETVFSPLDFPAPNDQRAASGAPGPGYWQQQVDYVIRATLDEDARTITGRESIVYINNSPDPLTYIWLHLEQNLFRPDSDGALANGPNVRFGTRDGFSGGVNLSVIQTLEGQPLTYHVYDTLCRIDLPQPIEPRGGRFTFEVQWSFAIPPYGGDRMGIDTVEQGTIFQIAQWFPAAAVYDDVHGWNTLPYLGNGEFYTNFGSFDVKLTVPRSHIVAATGVLQNPGDVLTPDQITRLDIARTSKETVIIRGFDEVADPATRPGGDEGTGQLTWHFIADDVRTFAWTSSAAFIWDAAWASGGGCGPSGAGTLCQSVYPKEAIGQWNNSTDMLRFSIEHYSEKWFPYPYPIATNVNGIVGGMEYPMIIFCSERHDERGLFGVTTHEIGHNWFPMLVNTDERRHAWMDEGFNSFINIYAGRQRYGEDSGGDGGDATKPRAFAQYFIRPHDQPMVTAPDFNAPGALGYLQYDKPSMGLYLLREEILGAERFDIAFREYITRWAFKSPTPSDFFRTMEDAAGVDLAWFWRGWFLEVGTLDQAVGGCNVSGDPASSTADATFLNKRELVMPLRFRVTYDDGATEDRRLPVQSWATSNTLSATWDTGGKQIIRIEVDPDGKLPDVDRGNNVWDKP